RVFSASSARPAVSSSPLLLCGALVCSAPPCLRGASPLLCVPCVLCGEFFFSSSSLLLLCGALVFSVPPCLRGASPLPCGDAKRTSDGRRPSAPRRHGRNLPSLLGPKLSTEGPSLAIARPSLARQAVCAQTPASSRTGSGARKAHAFDRSHHPIVEGRSASRARLAERAKLVR